MTGEELTIGNIIDQIHRWGGMVQSRTRQGSKPPVVAIYMHNCIEYPAIYIGAISVGGVISPLNPAYTAGKMRLPVYLN